MDVVGDLARVDDGVNSRKTDTTGALHTPEGVGRADQAGGGSGEKRLEHGVSKLG